MDVIRENMGLKNKTDTTVECTLSLDFEELERIVRCVFPDIVKYYEEKRKPEMSASLTDDAVLSDNDGAEKTVSETEGGIKI